MSRYSLEAGSLWAIARYYLSINLEGLRKNHEESELLWPVIQLCLSWVLLKYKSELTNLLGKLSYVKDTI